MTENLLMIMGGANLAGVAGADRLATDLDGDLGFLVTHLLER